MTLLTVDQREALAAIPVPERTETYEPVAYLGLIERLGEWAGNAGCNARVESVSLVGRPDEDNPVGAKRLFGVMSLTDNDSAVVKVDADGGMRLDNEFGEHAMATGTVNDPFGVSTMVGFRASHDKSMACGVVAGGRVFVCSNMAFSGQWVYHRKHTPNVWSDLESKVARFFGGLRSRIEKLERFQDVMRHTAIDVNGAKALLVDCVLSDAMPAKDIPRVWGEVTDPSYPEVKDLGGCVYRVYSAVTHASYKRYRDDKVMDMSANLMRVMAGATPHDRRN